MIFRLAILTKKRCEAYLLSYHFFTADFFFETGYEYYFFYTRKFIFYFCHFYDSLAIIYGDPNDPATYYAITSIVQ